FRLGARGGGQVRTQEPSEGRQRPDAGEESEADMTNLLAFANLGWGEIAVILLVVLLLFGSAKIPQLMRGFGQGINEFKKGLKEGENEPPKQPPEPPAPK